MTDKIIWRRSFPNHFLIQHADKSDTCVFQNCHHPSVSVWLGPYLTPAKCLFRSFFLLERLIRLVFAPFFCCAPPPRAGEGLKQYESALCHFAVGQQTIVNDLIGLEMECIAVGFGEQFNRESDYIQPTSVIRVVSADMQKLLSFIMV